MNQPSKTNEEVTSSEKIEQAIQLGMKELKETYKHPNTPLIQDQRAEILAQLGVLLWKKDDFREARKYFLMALTEYESLKDQFKIANVKSSLGSLFIQMGEYSLALRYNLEALEYWNTKNFLNERIAALQNVGICYLQMKEDIKAADYLLKALQMAVYLEDESQFANTIQVLLEYYEKQQRYDMLLELKRKALDFWTTLNLPLRQFKTLIDLGVICQILNEFKTALNYFKQAYNIAYNMADLEKMYLAEGFIGECYVKLGDISQARKIYLQTFKLAVYLNVFSDHQEAVDSMRLLLLTLGFSRKELDHEEKKALFEAQKDHPKKV
ncbi:MAG: tetratricopeptide repeat protein [Promethearchaeota archaeon]